MEVCRIFWTHSRLAEVQKKTSGTTTTEGGAQPQKHNHCLGVGGGTTRNRNRRERGGILTDRIFQGCGPRPRAEATLFPGNRLSALSLAPATEMQRIYRTKTRRTPPTENAGSTWLGFPNNWKKNATTGTGKSN